MLRLNETKNLVCYGSKHENTKRSYQLARDKMPLGLAVTDLHYFILYPDCLIIVSQITETVI